MQKLIRYLSIFACMLSQAIACGDRPKLSDFQRNDASGQGEVEGPSADSSVTGENTSPDNPESASPTVMPPAGSTDKPAVSPAAGSGPATGTTVISFTPVRYAAAQYPAYVYAVWITDANNKYIKTVSARAATRMRYLDKWLTAAGVVAPTQPDGVAGASLTYPATPAPVSVTWDMKDKAGAFVPQGNYTINIQLTSANNTGLSLSVPVVISAAGIMKTDTTMATGITAVTAKHTP